MLAVLDILEAAGSVCAVLRRRCHDDLKRCQRKELKIGPRFSGLLAAGLAIEYPHNF